MQSSRVSTEFGEGPAFGGRQFEPEEQHAIQATLQSLPSPQTQQLGGPNVRMGLFPLCIEREEPFS